MSVLLTGLKIAILVTSGFEQSEMIRPRQALVNEGAIVHIIALDQDKVKGWHWDFPKEGDAFAIDVPLDKANANDYDALLLPGGLTSPDDLRLNDKAIKFVAGFANKPIAAICHGPWLLIDANLMRGKRVTSWPSIKNDLKNVGGIWEDKEVVRDGNLITSRMPDDIPAFNKAMISLFGETSSKKNK